MSSLLAAGLLAADPQTNKAGPLALLVVALLGIATVLLVRSMSKHLRRVPESFDPPAPPADRPPADPTADPPGAGRLDR
jgi:hypothetical protein